MHDNNTVQQLSEALNELLDAYDKLKSENNTLKEVNENLEENLALKTQENEDLEERIISLTDTTEHHTNEIDTMLGRIKTILSSEEDNTQREEEVEQLEYELTTENITIEQSSMGEQEQTTMDIEDETQYNEKKNVGSDKEIDLGRMQSLLNGFNN